MLTPFDMAKLASSSKLKVPAAALHEHANGLRRPTVRSNMERGDALAAAIDRDLTRLDERGDGVDVVSGRSAVEAIDGAGHT